MRFNLIGFNFPTKPNEYKHCVVHPGSRLIPNVQNGTFFCPMCGTPYLQRDTQASERFAPEFGPQSSQTRIYSAKKPKRYFDDNGNEINDAQLLKDIANGKHVISYHEIKSGEDKTIVRK